MRRKEDKEIVIKVREREGGREGGERERERRNMQR